VGEQGFSAPFTPATEKSFYYKGIYGQGVGGSSNQRLVADILGLVEQRDRLPALGEFSRQFVVQHFSLEAVSARLAECLRRAVDEMPGLYVSAADGVRTAAVYLRERRFLWRSLPPVPIENIDEQNSEKSHANVDVNSITAGTSNEGHNPGPRKLALP
jgi:hypothetical protein